VDTAVVTHAHSDHARAGSQRYIASRRSEGLLRHRLGADIALSTWEWGTRHRMGDVTVSLHPAGHILGSAQVRLEHDGQVWVVSGDYKRGEDPTCDSFEVLPCDTFITEATFALPVYRWPAREMVMDDIYEWWQSCAARGISAVLFCYSLGKAQRILAAMAERTAEPVLIHGAMHEMCEAYRASDIRLAATERVSEMHDRKQTAGRFALAPPGAAGSAWMKRFAKGETGFASGWMTIRGIRRRQGYDRGFVLSDHADWPELLQTIKETGCSRVLATHGKTDVLVRYLQESGVDAAPLETLFASDGGGD
jgi:putative mRNA 3-end processing factor